VARRIEYVYTPENEAPLFSEAMDKYRAGDLAAALAALREFVGAPDREFAVEVRPYVAAALLNIAGILDFQGEAQAALDAYDAAFTRFSFDSEAMSQAWLAEPR
jgi:tetratricopeptide (TPR) repeat protein